MYLLISPLTFSAEKEKLKHTTELNQPSHRRNTKSQSKKILLVRPQSCYNDS